MTTERGAIGQNPRAQAVWRTNDDEATRRDEFSLGPARSVSRGTGMGALVIDDHSLREYFHGGIEAARRARVMLEMYYPLLRAVFPIDGEIETIAAYDAYLHDPAGEWDIVALDRRV